MSVLSKSSVPSLFDIAFLSFGMQAVPVHKQIGVLRLSIFCSSLDIFNGVVSRGHEEDNSIVYSHQKKDQILTWKGVPNSSKLQRFDGRNIFKLANYFLACVFLFIPTILKLRREFSIETLSKTDIVLLKLMSGFLKSTAFGPFFLQIAPELIREKCLMYFRDSPEILEIFGKFCLQLPRKVIIFEMDLKVLRRLLPKIMNLRTFLSCASSKTKKFKGNLPQIRKSSEMPSCLDPISKQLSLVRNFFEKDPEQLQLCDFPASTTVPNNEDRKNYQQDNEEKLKYICSMCREDVRQKKFFDERRIGILSNCDCRICYGCLRRETCTTEVVKGPVECPLCSAESDIVGANKCWIINETKGIFFALLKENRIAPLPNPLKSGTKLSSFFKGEEEPLDTHQKLEVPAKCIWTSGSVKSDIIKESTPLMKGEEESFDMLQKRKRAWNWTVFCEKLETISASTSLRKDEPFDMVKREASGRKVGMTVFPVIKDDFATRVVPMIQVN